MSLCVCLGASLQCSFGVAPSTLAVLPANRVTVDGVPAATVMDFAPIVNVPPFGMCTSMANPMVIAATAAAMGVPTPMPCIPVPTGPWIVGAPTVVIGAMAALNSDAKLACSWGGVIQILVPGQASTLVP